MDIGRNVLTGGGFGAVALVVPGQLQTVDGLVWYLHVFFPELF